VFDGIGEIMPYDWSVDRETGTAYIKATGESSFEESADAFTRLSKDPDFKPDTQILLDVREHRYTPSLVDGRRLLSLLDDLGMHNRIGLLVTTRLHFGVGRQMSLLGSLKNLKIRVFTEPDEAREWLESA